MFARHVIAIVGALVLVAGCSPKAPQSSAATSSPTGAAPDDSGFTLVATGDLLIHPELTDQATADGGGKRDYDQILAGVRPAISSADLAICHLETPLAPAAGPFKGYPDFSAPPEIATAIADTGYDDCSTASNHTLDMGADGITRTLDTLDAVGIPHTGSARSAQEANTPLLLDVGGIKVGHVAYTFGFNGRKVPAGQPWLANTLDTDAVLAAARKARAAGAQIVVASLHWGTEYKQDATSEQQRIAKELLSDPAIDLIIGHHAHVVQPFEKINGKWVAYGLGNLIARHSEPRGTTEEGVIARFHFTRTGSSWTVDRAEYLPTLIDLGPPIRLRDLTTDHEADPARARQALARTDQIVLSRGAAAEGLTRPGQ
ncbi:CapA family protein [Amycolatopsis taiwanensis]|uniref:CapA family protein n=1 Tax=Amycolatopsis taiwanensis TaxID=342230 RepID=UPI000486C24E|nr:CapA family protein [Amycolatopsis taiwanensis]